jgi:N-acetylglucosamine-6-phosphate deacetylase
MHDEAALSGLDTVTGKAVRVSYRDGAMSAIEPLLPDAVPPELYLSPGLIDLQVNGYAGHDLNSGAVTVDSVVALVHALRAVGTLVFTPTLVTASPGSLLDTLSAIAEARRRDADLAHAMPRIHIEGPWIASEDGPRGAHPPEHVRPPDSAEFERWQQASGGIIGMVTLSPHYQQAPAVTAALVARGITVAIGHTAANDAQIDAVVSAGASLSTHLGNGIASTLQRHPNPIWTQLGDDRLHASLIADGFHLAPAVFRSMLRAKGLGRTVLVSDSAQPAGLPPGRYDGVGGTVELTGKGRLGIVGTEYLAGSGMNLAQCVARAISMGGIGLGEALLLATRNPGRFLGGYGRLEVGAPADLISFRWAEGATTLEIVDIVANGKAIR